MFDYRKKSQLPKLDICKIRTERFRDMDNVQLEQSLFFMGPVTMAEHGKRADPRALVKRFILNLRNSRNHEEMPERSMDAYRKTYGEEPMPQAKIVAGYKREVDHIERQIWDAQQKKGCAIATRDSPARDYVRGGGTDQDLVNRARGRRKAKIR